LTEPNPDRNGVDSSILTKPAAIVCWLVCCVLAVLFEKTPLAFFLGFVFVLTALSYLWARAALKNVVFTRHTERSGVFPGQTFPVTRTLANEKALPLIWAEICEACEADEPAAPPPSSIITRTLPGDESGKEIVVHERFYTLSLVPWYGKVSFEDHWTAHRRGIMELGASVVRSGDGFGLCATGHTYEPASPDRIVVFPALTEVSAAGIVNDMWDTRSRETGYLEDRSVVKSVRDYMAGDPVRNINMRLLARGQALKTNVYEIVTPDAVLFILDPGSFRGTDARHFEDALSVTASLIDALTRKGLSVSIMTPASAWYGETCTTPSCARADRFQMLALLAAASEKDGPILGLPPGHAEEAGKIYYIAADAKSVTAPGLLSLLPAHKTRILTPDELSAYCRGGKAAS
jgi:uncharacterized protein (DUF58 family)